MIVLQNNQKGFAAFLITILILVIMFGIAISFTILTLGQEKIFANVRKSNKAYYLAEAGIEDILLRLVKNKNWTSPYTLNIDGGYTTIDVSEVIGGSRTITAEGNMNDRIRKMQIVYEITAEAISFYYGVQVGDLGLQMDGNAMIHGNIFSNGLISGASNTRIHGDAISAGPTGMISSMKIDSSSTESMIPGASPRLFFRGMLPSGM